MSQSSDFATAVQRLVRMIRGAMPVMKRRGNRPLPSNPCDDEKRRAGLEPGETEWWNHRQWFIGEGKRLSTFAFPQRGEYDIRTFMFGVLLIDDALPVANNKGGECNLFACVELARLGIAYRTVESLTPSVSPDATAEWESLWERLRWSPLATVWGTTDDQKMVVLRPAIVDESLLEALDEFADILPRPDAARLADSETNTAPDAWMNDDHRRIEDAISNFVPPPGKRGPSTEQLARMLGDNLSGRTGHLTDHLCELKARGRIGNVGKGRGATGWHLAEVAKN